MEVKKVLVRTDGIKYVIIPKASTIKAGKLVLITDDITLINKFMEAEDGRKRRSKKN